MSVSCGKGLFVKFAKMHGCGNDYIFIDGSKEPVKTKDKPELTRYLSDRNSGVGSDGVIFINPSEEADFEMEMYNADGTRGEMCGNGIRCVAKYVYDRGLTNKKKLSIISCGAVKELSLTIQDKKVIFVKVDMGEPRFMPKDIPVDLPGDRIINEPISVCGREFHMTCMSMGNPHAVVFVERTDGLRLDELGPAFENHPCFPNRVNAEFVQVLNRQTIRMRVWERGTGETLACGTGACAAVTAGILNGLLEDQVTVRLPGGELEIFWNRQSNRIYMTGPAVHVFDGEIEWNTE